MDYLLAKSAHIIRKFYFYLFISWTVLVIISFGLIRYYDHKNTVENAMIEARTFYELNKYYRVVLSNLGGVYVPVEKLEPNPYLLVPDRDITTTEGKKLTLVNPAYMTRIVFETIKAGSDLPVLNKITSLKAINPVNNPDEWEKMALVKFEQGKEEAIEITAINGEDYLRLMRPFHVESGCLKCHKHQGYNIGDIRGGISISVPLRPYYDVERHSRNIIIAVHLALWALVSGIILVFMKITVRSAKTFMETRTLSLHDPLTGLANRRYMEIGLREGFHMAKRYGNQLSVIMADLDDFKKYNDSRGHKDGDVLLVKIAGIILSETRRTDLAVRYGGEEFLILLRQTGLSEAVEVAERMRKSIEAETEITASFGIAAYHEDIQKAEDIVNNADKALYEAKQKGKNRVEAF